MEKIGSITYSTLERQVEKDWVALNVHSNPSTKTGLSFRKLLLESRIEKDIPRLASTMSRAVNKLYEYYLPVFEDLELFDTMVEEIVCKLTFFEHKKIFELRKHHPDSKIVGVHHRYDHIVPGGPLISLGSYIKIDKGIRGSVIARLFHEYGHEMHLRSCSQKIAPFDYLQYDRFMKEVIAISAERAFGRYTYGTEPHKTAEELLRGLEKLPEFKEMPFHERWKWLLCFPKHQRIKNHLYRQENK